MGSSTYGNSSGGGWLVQKFGGTSVGKFPDKVGRSAPTHQGPWADDVHSVRLPETSSSSALPCGLAPLPLLTDAVAQGEPLAEPRRRHLLGL